MKKTTKKKTSPCLKCDAHETISDPDPGDWFRDGDMAVVCKIAKNPDFDENAKYVADRQEFRVISGGLGPWDWDNIKIPKWCPKKRKLAKEKGKKKMRKLILLLGMMIILTGCSKEIKLETPPWSDK